MSTSDLLFLLALFVLWGSAAWMTCGFDLSLHDVRTVLERLATPFSRTMRALVRRMAGDQSHAHQANLGDVSEMTDIVRLGLLAGLSFDAALAVYCENKHGVLPEAMNRAHMSWQMGLCSREAALVEVANAVGVRQLESFAVAVDQAYVLGAPLAETLARQGAEMRAAHRLSAEREIERAPVKLLIPTGTLILPALLLSILGPLLAGGGIL